MEQDHHLVVRGLSRSFGGIKAVDGVSFNVRRGETFGLLGPNGAGKTTTINMICGLLKASTGGILLNGRELSESDRRHLIGVCPQEITVWDLLTCREQLVMSGRLYGAGFKESRRKADELLERMGLSDRRDSLAKTLSGGMLRRLNIILGLVHDPEILILDEPQAGLDPQSRVLVRDTIRSLTGRMTVLLTTHDMEEADKLSDRVAVMDRGKILVIDTPESLKSSGVGSSVIEAGLKNASPEISRQLVGSLAAKGLAAVVKDGTLSVTRQDSASRTGDDVASLMRSVLDTAAEKDVDLSSLAIRNRTLEDVFISLTGRGLRE